MRRRLAFVLVLVAACSAFGASKDDPASDVKAKNDASASGNVADAGDGGASPEEDAALPPGGKYALHFDGGGYVEVPDLDMPKEFTIEAWMNPDHNGLDSEQDIIAKDRSGDSSTQCRLAYRADNSLYFQASTSDGKSHGYTDSSNTRLLSSSQKPGSGTWVHVAVTKKDDKTSVLYINGKVEKQITLDADFAIPTNSDVHFRIGGRYAPDSDAVEDGFIGAIYGVRVWDFARTADQILNTMSSSAAGIQGLIADYQFTEGSGTSVASTTNDHPATIHNASWQRR
jgi:hypothetical protein